MEVFPDLSVSSVPLLKSSLEFKMFLEDLVFFVAFTVYVSYSTKLTYLSFSLARGVLYPTTGPEHRASQ